MLLYASKAPVGLLVKWELQVLHLKRGERIRPGWSLSADGQGRGLTVRELSACAALGSICLGLGLGPNDKLSELLCANEVSACWREVQISRWLRIWRDFGF